MRLTKRNELGDYLFIDGENTCPNEVATKLGKLEDIEEELGIDLITLSKILKHGCYVKPWKKVWFSKVMTLQTNEFGILKLFDFNDNDYSLRNYGIDFALTKEELL